MKTPLLVLGLLGIVTTAYAGQWTAEQKAIWKNVETYWALDEKGDTDGFMEYFHEDYMGWFNRRPLPADRAEVARFVAHYHKAEKTVLTNLQPASINIHGDIAIVHYYYTRISEKDGKETTSSGRWTDILKKQGVKWVLIGDHGGPSGSGD